MGHLKAEAAILARGGIGFALDSHCKKQFGSIGVKALWANMSTFSMDMGSNSDRAVEGMMREQLVSNENG
jgi:hypothetical protein